MLISDLKRLAGVSQTPANGPDTVPTVNKAQYMRDHNIKPGTDEWFRLWFARPGLTKENPF